MGLAGCVTTSQGGSDIETLSAEHPDAIFKIPIDITEGVTPEKLDLVADKLGFQSTKVRVCHNSPKGSLHKRERLTRELD